MLVWERVGHREPSAARGDRRDRCLLVVSSFLAWRASATPPTAGSCTASRMGWHRSHHAPPGALRAQRPLPGVLLRRRRDPVRRSPGRCPPVVGRARGHGLRRGVPVRARGLHPSPSARADARRRATSTGCAMRTGDHHTGRRALRHAAARSCGGSCPRRRSVEAARPLGSDCQRPADSAPRL